MEPAKKAEREPRSPAAFTPDKETPGARLRRSLHKLLVDERPGVALARDIVLVFGILGILLGGLWAYTGQPFPGTSPVVVVESGSMMHPDSPYGHVGTIDPGDLVLVRDVSDRNDVQTAFGPGDRTGYGGRGDVIIYRPFGATDRTPIIHRAMTWVDVEIIGTDENGEPVRRYSYYDERGVYREDEPSVSLDSVRITEMRPPASGFVTKGDNPQTNPTADQINHIHNRLVEPEWIIGKARGEVPWLGLVKLGMTGNPPPSEFPDEPQCQVLKAFAPCDMWVMLGVSFGLVVVVPLGLDRLTKHNEKVRRWLT